MRDFKKLKIWQKAMEIAIEVYRIAKGLPTEEKFGLRSQITRAAVSVASNIAEGSAKSSDREYKQFCERSLGSCYELETQLLLAMQLGWLKNEKIMEQIMQEQKMLMSFIDRLGGKG